jgi:hypothetical protein
MQAHIQIALSTVPSPDAAPSHQRIPQGSETLPKSQVVSDRRPLARGCGSSSLPTRRKTSSLRRPCNDGAGGPQNLRRGDGCSRRWVPIDNGFGESRTYPVRGEHISCLRLGEVSHRVGRNWEAPKLLILHIVIVYTHGQGPGLVVCSF